ncbi:hypothetical protein [Embleya sp. NPDC050493]
MIDDTYQTPVFWTESADTVVLGSKNENDADKSKYFEGTKTI